LRYVCSGIVRERFVGYVHAHKLDASALSQCILKTLSDMDIDIAYCVSQCYDGVSVMSGHCVGVSAKIPEKNDKAVYEHCCAHRLNLVLVDTAKQLPTAADFFSLLQMLCVFMSSSNPHDLFLAKQTELRQHREVRLKKLSDTRWSCRYASIKALTSTFSAVLAILEEICESDDSDGIVEAQGILQMKTFQFTLCLVMFERIFAITLKLSDILQAERLDFAGAVTCIEVSMETLHDMQSEEEWKKIWEKAVSLATEHSIGIEHPRSRRNR